MPKTIAPKEVRISVQIPGAMVSKVDEIVRDYPIYGNRQQFVEAAVREKIEKVLMLLSRLPSDSEDNPK